MSTELKPELKAQIDKEAQEYGMSMDNSSPLIQSYAKKDYTVAAEVYALKWQQAEEMMDMIVHKVRSAIQTNLAAEMDGNANIRNFIIEFQEAFNDYNNYKQTKDGTVNG